MDKGFCYEQSSGELWAINGGWELPLGVGFAGHSDGRNNVAMERVRNVGPLPAGVYEMRVDQHPRFRAPAIRLTQTEGETFGRSGFWIHGGTLSHGCIILDRELRSAVAHLVACGFNRLKVVH